SGLFKGKARIAQFDLGEDDQSEYMHVTITMIDAASAEQLKNLMIGVSALLSLSQFEGKPLLESMLVRAEGPSVVLNWSWPAAKLDDLARMIQGRNDEHGRASTSPSTQSAG